MSFGQKEKNSISYSEAYKTFIRYGRLKKLISWFAICGPSGYFFVGAFLMKHVKDKNIFLVLLLAVGIFVLGLFSFKEWIQDDLLPAAEQKLREKLNMEIILPIFENHFTEIYWENAMEREDKTLKKTGLFWQDGRLYRKDLLIAGYKGREFRCSDSVILTEVYGANPRNNVPKKKCLWGGFFVFLKTPIQGGCTPFTLTSQELFSKNEQEMKEYRFPEHMAAYERVVTENPKLDQLCYYYPDLVEDKVLLSENQIETLIQLSDKYRTKGAKEIWVRYTGEYLIFRFEDSNVLNWVGPIQDVRIMYQNNTMLICKILDDMIRLSETA